MFRLLTLGLPTIYVYKELLIFYISFAPQAMYTTHTCIRGTVISILTPQATLPLQLPYILN